MKRALVFVALLVIVVGIMGFQTSAYYTFEKLFLRTPSTPHPASSHGGANNNSGSNSGSHGNNSNSTSISDLVEVNTIINYGNGNTVWFNQTKVSVGLNFFDLTLLLAHNNANATLDSNFNPPEHYVTGINGVLATPTSPYYWSLWSYCPKDAAWQYSEVGADWIMLTDHGIYGWYYQVGTLPPIAGAPSLPIGSLCST